MKPIYIHSAIVISAQDSFEGNSLFPLEISEEKVKAKHPDYKEYITPALARRMAPAVKMGSVAAKMALQKANIDNPDAIIVGTGMGCMQDTEKFLNTMLANQEEHLTPTAFIQSTHNTVSAQIAIELNCKNYNTTYVHGSLSFENALQDAQLLLSEQKNAMILVGGVDELGTEFIDYVIEKEKNESHSIITPFSEGASFFVVSNEKTDNAFILQDIQTVRDISEENVSTALHRFLERNKLKINSIDVFLTGNNGDASDGYYTKLESLLPESKTISFKNYCGEYHTASAFALWMAVQLLQKKNKLGTDFEEKTYKNVLIYNQFKGRNHSFTLVSV